MGEVWKEIVANIPKSAKWWLLALCALCGGVIFFMSTLWKSYPHDNAIEESVEQVIHDQSGVDVDLSPYSPEAGK